MYFANLASGEDVTLTAAVCQGRILSEIVDFDAKPPYFHGVTLGQNRGFLRNLFRGGFFKMESNVTLTVSRQSVKTSNGRRLQKTGFAKVP